MVKVWRAVEMDTDGPPGVARMVVEPGGTPVHGVTAAVGLLARAYDVSFLTMLRSVTVAHEHGCPCSDGERLDACQCTEVLVDYRVAS